MARSEFLLFKQSAFDGDSRDFSSPFCDDVGKYRTLVLTQQKVTDSFGLWTPIIHISHTMLLSSARHHHQFWALLKGDLGRGLMISRYMLWWNHLWLYEPCDWARHGAEVSNYYNFEGTHLSRIERLPKYISVRGFGEQKYIILSWFSVKNYYSMLWNHPKIIKSPFRLIGQTSKLN
jgi:hypothetical protein